MAETIEITGTFIEERMRFENTDVDVIIGNMRINDPEDGIKVVSIKGPSLVDELRPGQDYIFYGKWTKYTNKRTRQTEDQFAFQSFIKEQPATREAVISYLAQHGEGIGIGRARATKIWESFGSDSLRICREDPLRIVSALAGHLNVTVEQSEDLAKKLIADVSTEKAKLSLVSLLEGRGFPKVTGTLALQKWGNKSAQIIRRDPYRLMVFRSCGFKRCDAMYLDLKLNPTRLKRQALSAWYSVARITNGNTWFPISYPETYIRQTIAGSDVDTEKALQLATRAKALTECQTNATGVLASQFDTKTTRWFAESTKATHETQIAQSVVFSKHESLLWPDANEIPDTTEHQRMELSKSFQDVIGIFGGAPGTGKTWTVASLVQYLAQIYGLRHIWVAAPTGKAAVRVTENLSSRGINLRARTCHSILMQLERLGTNHFPCKFLIIDESSMLDTDLMAALLRARSVGTHVLFVGDVNQLPPVGHGAPLRDMIAAGVAYGELREIMRNSGGIVETCAAIRDNPTKINWHPGDNLIFEERSKPESQIECLLQWLDKAAEHGIDPVWDCQPVVAVNKNSKLSRKDLNEILQQRLNQQPGVDGIPFRLGDKLVNTENRYFALIGSNQCEETETNDKNEVYVANGELAKVIDIQGRKVVVELQSPHRIVDFTIGPRTEKKETDSEEGEAASTGCSFELGYALSVHKSQGSDWPWVFPMIDDYAGAKQICDRSWMFTAISRAKTKCVLIGKQDVADRMCSWSSIVKRKTFLRERILQLQSIEQLAEV
jgi:exodeoxyribonuclease V alpha subunit